MKNGIIEDFDKINLPELKQDYFMAEADESKKTQTLALNKQVVDVERKPLLSIVEKYRVTDIVMVVAVIIVVNLLLLMYCRRRMKKQQNAQMNMQVQTAVSQYFALSGTEV